MATTYQVTQISNPNRKNPLLAALGAGANPQKKKEKKPMAKAKAKAKPKGGKKMGHNPVLFASFTKKKKPNGKHHHKPRRSRNPIEVKLGGQQLSLKTLAKLIFGGLAGVAVTKFAAPTIAESLKIDMSGNAARTGMNAVVAFAGGKAVEQFDPEIGYGFQFGAYMHVASVGLNSFMPDWGKRIALQGGRGVGSMGRILSITPAMNTALRIPTEAATAAAAMPAGGVSRAYRGAYQ